MKKYSNTGLMLAVVIIFLAGCAQQSAVIPETQAPDLVWPSLPEVPRIRFLYTITGPENINNGRGWIRRTFDFLKGNPQQQIGSPYGLSKDDEERLYVVDTFYKTVHVFDKQSSSHYLFPEKPIEGFQNPIDIALGTAGRIYVSDSGSGLVHVFTGHGRQYINSIGEGLLQRPTGLAVNPITGELLVADTTNSRLVVFDEADLRFKRIVGEQSSAADGFHYPTNITVSKTGQVYITDSLNFRIQRLEPGLSFIKNFGGAGDSPGYFSRPKGIATDSDANVYVADALFDNIQIFDSEGRLLLAFGSPGNGRGEFWLPNAIFIDNDDRIYVSDSYNKRVQVFQYLKQDVR